VRYVGDHVAMVIAETLGPGQGAAELVEVQYGARSRPASIPPGRKDEGQPQLHDEAPNNTVLSTGSSATRRPSMQAFAGADHVTKLEFVNNRKIPNAIEPRAQMPTTTKAGELHPLHHLAEPAHRALVLIAPSIGIAPEHKLRIIAPDVGGGFGSKIFIYPRKCAACGRRRRSAGPVKWTADAPNPSCRTPTAATT
jgi:aerobic carbon-monoxide dehydrogenase large subunit